MTKPTASEAFEPDWAIPPGATIAAILDARALSREKFAHSLGKSIETVQRLVQGVETLDFDLAVRLEECLGSPHAFWLAREAQYRSDIARLQKKTIIAETEVWARQFPLREMANLGWIKQFKTASEAVQECFRLFSVSDLTAWNKQYSSVASATAFRMSPASKTNPLSVLAWLRWSEVLAERIPSEPWNAELFRDNLQKIRRLTWRKDPTEFLPALRKLCAEAGVAVVVARTPKGCPASGATRFLSTNKAMIVLSFRYRSDDQFWFTFFHEAAHLLLHSHDALFLEDESDVTIDEEEEANAFAERMIVPTDHVAEFAALRPDVASIKTFARRAGIAPGLVVGQLQYFNRVQPDRLNGLKRRYAWDQIPSDSLTP